MNIDIGLPWDGDEKEFTVHYISTDMLISSPF